MLSLLLAALPPLVDLPAGQVEVLPHAQLEAALRELGESHPCATFLEYGRSAEGRALCALRLSAPELAPATPAVLVIGGVEGERVWESGLVLSQARALCAAYGDDEAATALLDSTTFYFVPRADVDGAASRFRTPLHERRAAGFDVDNDRDGRRGEDGPTDLNLDDWITSMRVPDPDGAWRLDERDSRALVEADASTPPAERYALYAEAGDADGDGEVGEDPPQDGSFASNFPAGWPEHEPEAGRFPTDMPAVRALCDFVIARPQIGLVVVYGAQDNLRGGAQKAGSPDGRIPAPGVMGDDEDAHAELAELYREHLELDASGSAQLYAAGSFARWAYEHRGLWTLCASPWSMPEEAPEPAEDEEESGEEPSEDAESADEDEAVELDGDAGRLAWIDATGEDWRFIDWAPYEHPTLGSVELGGFAPFALFEPPVAEWSALADAQLGFVMDLGARLPRVSLESAEAEDLGGGLWRLSATVRNRSALPYQSAAASRARTVRPLRVRLLGAEGARLLAGERQQLVRDLDALDGKAELEWLVSGVEGGSMRIEIDSDHAGRATQNFEVQ